MSAALCTYIWQLRQERRLIGDCGIVGRFRSDQLHSNFTDIDYKDRPSGPKIQIELGGSIRKSVMLSCAPLSERSISLHCFLINRPAP